VFIVAISAGTFVTAIVSLVVVPRSQSRPAPPIPTVARPDTLSVIADGARARGRLAQAESALFAARKESAAAAAAATVRPDTLNWATAQARDSLELRARALEQQLTRAEQAPLASSYKSLAELPELRSDPRVRALLDSLSEIEREREGFGAVGGVDPIFVALTSRANEIGRTIQTIAGERRTALRNEAAALVPKEPVVAVAPTTDTTSFVAARDSARSALDESSAELARRRATANALDLEEERARERANAVAPPLALLASAFVLSAVIGFAAAFIGELRRPRVSEAQELERLLGIRVLSTVETPMPSVDRGRREADRAAPPYFDPGAEGYQLAYLGLATEHATELMATITGDDPAIAAVVACNLAAIAADEARNTLVADLEPSCSASAALRVRARPGIIDLVNHNASWPDATISAKVGRDKSVDLVPYGVGAKASAEQVVALLRQDAGRLVRYYDAVFLLASVADAAIGLPAVLPSPEVVYCAQPGITPLRKLRDELDQLRAAGGLIRGVVLWNAERPMLPTPRELAANPRGGRISEPRVAVATR
jgi:Mrp family chromosome partitioning ATPase